MVNHGVPQPLIDRTFGEARRFHDQPLDRKMALRMNEHNNGYMTLGRYAVWTSDVNVNDKPDLNEAFFSKRERGADDPLLEFGPALRRPEPVARRPARIPRHRARLHERHGRADPPRAPVCAVALDLPPDRPRCRLRGEPVLVPPHPLSAGTGRTQPVRHRSPYRRQLPDLSRPDRGPGTSGAGAVGRLARRAVHSRLLRRERGRHDVPLDERPLQVDAAPRPAPGGTATATRSRSSSARTSTP